MLNFVRIQNEFDFWVHPKRAKSISNNESTCARKRKRKQNCLDCCVILNFNKINAEMEDSQMSVAEEPMDVVEEVDLTRDETAVIESQDLFDSLPPAVSTKPSKPPIPTTLPLARVKRICKLDPGVKNITLDAVKLISFCTEHFIEALVQASVVLTKEDGRKTCQLKDLQRAIRRSWLFYMLDDALEDWPEPGAAGGGVDEEEVTAENEVIELEEDVGDEAGDIDIIEEEEENDDPEVVDLEADESIEKGDITADEGQLTPKKAPAPLRDIEDL
uniref:CBFD_NFYB_HMF domain-containing protein n=1 Tax=Panagrellus redivivus TaxID=6233 RepID=A0A7E4V6S1_PANRE